MRERDYLWDNIKALLIFLVVAGHALEVCSLHFKLATAADTLIYSFHMPAFVFVSGFFAKRYCDNSMVRAEKAGLLFAYYAVFQILFIMIRLFMDIKIKRLSFESPCRGLWYLLALFFMYLLVPLVEKLPGWLVITGSVVLALIVANDVKATHYFSILRFFLFAPFFFVGYYVNSDFIKKIRAWKLRIRLPLGLCCAAASVSLWLLNLDHAWSRLFYCKVNNIKLGVSFWEGSFLRICVYMTAILMIAAIVLIMPDKKTILAKVGQNSLQIFVLHMLLIIVLFDSKILTFRIDSIMDLALAILVSLAVTLVLSLKVFSYPFKWIQAAVNKLYSVKTS